MAAISTYPNPLLSKQSIEKICVPWFASFLCPECKTLKSDLRSARCQNQNCGHTFGEYISCKGCDTKVLFSTDKCFVCNLVTIPEHILQSRKKAMDIGLTSIRSKTWYIEVMFGKESAMAIIDSGAAITLISRDIAKQCGLTDQIDRYRTQMISGVNGNQKSDGLINCIEMVLKDTDSKAYGFDIEMTVANANMQMILLGANFLRNCTIDFSNELLTINKNNISVTIQLFSQ
jgi:hypothetical protein